MPAIEPAAIVIKDRYGDQMSLIRRLSGQPAKVATALLSALGGNRILVRQSAGLLLVAIAASGNRNGSRIYCAYNNDAALSVPHTWRYHIKIHRYQAAHIHIFRIADSGEFTLYFDGPLDTFLTEELRYTRRRGKRDPAADAHLDSLTPVDDPARAPDTRGVREYTKDEFRRRAPDRRQRKPPRKTR